MKTKELRELSVEELNKKLQELSEELFNLRFRHAIGQLENPSALKTCKKDIAKVKTLLREKELNAQGVGVKNYGKKFKKRKSRYRCF